MKLEVGSLSLTGKVLDSLRLGIGLRGVLTDETLQEGIDVFGSLGHGLLQRIGGVVGIAHNLSLLGSQLGNLDDNGEGVMLARTISTMNGGLINLLAQVAIVETGQGGLLGGVDDDNGVWGLTATALCILLALGDVGLTETCQVFLLIDPHHSLVGGCRQHVAPLLLKVGDAEINLFHALHLVVGQQGAIAHKALVGFFEQFLVLTSQTLKFAVIDLTDAFEQRLVKRDLVLQIGHHGRHLLLNLCNLGGLVSTGQGIEHTRDMIEQAVTLLKSQDSVLESGRILILNDLRNVVLRLLDSHLEGRQIVCGLDLTEIGCSEGDLTLLQQGILTLSILTR